MAGLFRRLTMSRYKKAALPAIRISLEARAAFRGLLPPPRRAGAPLPRSGDVRGGRMGAFWQAVTVWQALAGAWGGCGPDFGGAFGASGGGRGAASGRKREGAGPCAGLWARCGGVAMPAAVLALRAGLPMTCGPFLSEAGRDDPRRRGAIGAGRYIPLRGGACLPPAPMTCGPSLYIGGGAGMTHGGGLRPLRGGILPCGRVLACVCSR